MDKELEKRLISELSSTTHLLIDSENLTDTEKIDSEIEKLTKIGNRINRKILFSLIGCTVLIALLFFPVIYNGDLGGFIKGLLSATLFFLIMNVKQFHHSFDREMFILKLLREFKEK